MSASMMFEVEEAFNADRNALNKFEMTRRLLTRLNELGDGALKVRRELVRRVVEFEDFTRCWDSDVLKAKGLVAEIRHTVQVKDSFTRMNQAREQAEDTLKAERERQRQAQLVQARARRERIAGAKTRLFAVFAETDPHRRGKALEEALNGLFATYEILVEEDFRRIADDGGVMEQIDGVIEVNDETFLVEMKWWSSAMGPAELAQHMSRTLLRPRVSGLFISNSGYTPAALDACRDFLQHRLLVLCTLQEIVALLEREDDLVGFIRAKARAAKLHKKPFKEMLAAADLQPVR